MVLQSQGQMDSTHGDFVRRSWCLWLAVGLLLLGAVLNTIYLFNHCALDLTEDESHYWEWSRHLDYGYYSKPPGIAWMIWAAIRVGGLLGLSGDGSGAALMPVMRMAAVVCGIVSGMLSIFLARRMFRDDRASLAVIALSAAVPMFAVGSLLITIDAPMYMCWAGTVYCLWRVVDAGGRKGSVFWLYAAGLCAAAGMMFKPVLIALPICVLLGSWGDREGMRRAFKTWHAWGALAVMMCSQIPVVVWNAHHGWVTFRHILTQGGMGQQAGAVPSHKSVLQAVVLDPLARFGEYIGGQAGGMGGIMFVLLVIGVVVAWMKVRELSPRLATRNGATPENAEARTRWIFLLSFTLPLWAFYLIMNLWKRTELNWPAASYFTGMILLAGIFSEGWNTHDAKNRRAWRTWGGIAIVWGVLMTAVAMNADRFYPLAAAHLESLKGTAAYFSSWWHPKQWEPPLADKLRGMQVRADEMETVRAQMTGETGQEPLIITGRYDTSSSLAFYMPGHPFVFSIMSSVGGRQSQYDIWPGVNQQSDGKLTFAGRSAIIVGIDKVSLQNVVAPAFERLVGPEKLAINWHGITLKEVIIYRAYGFKGMPEHASGAY